MENENLKKIKSMNKIAYIALAIFGLTGYTGIFIVGNELAHKIFAVCFIVSSILIYFVLRDKK